MKNGDKDRAYEVILPLHNNQRALRARFQLGHGARQTVFAFDLRRRS
jgi:hypothetical protein